MFSFSNFFYLQYYDYLYFYFLGNFHMWLKMKVRDLSEDDANNDDIVPIAVQIFLWRQTTPFMRPRFGKVHDSACMVSYSHCLPIKLVPICSRFPNQCTYLFTYLLCKLMLNLYLHNHVYRCKASLKPFKPINLKLQ